MEFQITAWNGDSVRIEAENWLVAMGRALAFFQDDPAALGGLRSVQNADGSVVLDEDADGNGRRSWTLRPLQRAVSVVAVRARGQQMEEIEAPPLETRETPVPAPVRGPPPTLSMPVRPSLHKEVPVETTSLAERLFDMSFDIADAPPDDACRIGMELVLELVPAEAASVAIAVEQGIRYVAASGPVREAILGRTVGYGSGLAGQCLELRATLVVNDVRVDRRHLRAFDETTGYHTHAVLCVPIVDEHGLGCGVIQVLNPNGGTFASDAVEIVETIAKTLGTRLQG